MTTISSVGGSAWFSAAAMQRTQQRRGPSPEDMLSKLDSDGNGSVSGTALQGLLDQVAKKGGARVRTRRDARAPGCSWRAMATAT